MDLAFWEISVVYFVMQMKACDFLKHIVLIGPDKIGQDKMAKLAK